MKLTPIALILAGLIAGLPLQASIAASPADPSKVLRYIFPAAETGFDPAASHDLYSSTVVQSIFEPLYTYDYLARPAQLSARAADGLPEVADEGRTYTIRLKKGVYFAPDPAFNGKRREVTMADYVYSFKRLFDPRINSPHLWLFEGKIVGLDDMAAEARKTGKFDPNAKVAGFELLDSHTLRIRLTHSDYNLGMVLAHQPTSAVAREVVEKYQDAQGTVMANPVGTGAYRLTQWVRGSRIVLEANPEYRGFVWDFKAGGDPEDQAIVAQMKGKRMPQIGRIEINVMVEDQSRWLSFQNGETDLFELQGPLAPKAMQSGRLRPELAAKGVQLSRIIDPEISYYYFNMQDPLVGGMGKEKIALRRAIAMAHDVNEEIRIIWNGEAVPLDYPIPPGVVGHDPKYKNILRFDVKTANALLDKFSYKVAADGWRTLPDGKPLVVHRAVYPDSQGQQQAEMWKKTFNGIKIQMVADKLPFPEILKAEKECKLQSRTAPWIADYPDGDNFMMLFYGPNIHQNNNSCFQNADYDKLYVQSQKIPAGPERDALYRKMARLLEVTGAARIGYARYRNMLAQPKVIGFKKHPIMNNEWLYFDIDKNK